MRFFLTGHTGFKGAWLTKILLSQGHEVFGYSLPADRDSLFEKLDLAHRVSVHSMDDIRNANHLAQAVSEADPHVVVHLAAQPLVLRGYEDPNETFTTNVVGTLNLLNAVTVLRNDPVVLIVTTDKVYRPSANSGHVETDPLGGLDPYSASKAMADLLSQSWAKVHPELRLGIARAGNVIGPFDTSRDRLFPDIVRSVRDNERLEVRFPNAVRPWQHVLDCLSGYMAYIEALSNDEPVPTILNFGPNPNDFRSVADVLNIVSETRPDFSFSISEGFHPENQMLTLDSSLAQKTLNWQPVIPFHQSVMLSLEGLELVVEVNEIVEEQLNLHSKLSNLAELS